MPTLLDRLIRVTALSPSQMAHQLPGILLHMYYQERTAHSVLVDPGTVAFAGGGIPSVAQAGPMLGLEFTLNTDEAFQSVRIPDSYIKDGCIHAHWTKGGDADLSGRTVRWVVDYSVVNGRDQVASNFDFSVELTDVYVSAETTTRTIQRTPTLILPGLVAGGYLNLRLRALTPAEGTPMSPPCLNSLAFEWVERINEDPSD